MLKKLRELEMFPLVAIVLVVVAFWVGLSVGNAEVRKRQNDRKETIQSQIRQVMIKLNACLPSEQYEGHLWVEASEALGDLQWTLRHNISAITSTEPERREALQDVLNRMEYLVYQVRFTGEVGAHTTQEAVERLQGAYDTYFHDLDSCEDALVELIARVEANNGMF